MTTATDKVILYPAGGCFNRLRSEQTFLNDLLLSSFDGWEKADNKKQFVVQMILGKIPGGIWIYDRETGQAVRPEKKDAENRILQKMRDLKKSVYKSRSGTSVTSTNCSLDAEDAMSLSLATTLTMIRRTNRKPKPSSSKSIKKAIASSKKKVTSKKDEMEKTYFEYVMDVAYETEATATNASSPDSQSSADNDNPTTEVAHLREEIKFLQTLCMDQKRHIRWLKNKITSLKEETENTAPDEQ